MLLSAGGVLVISILAAQSIVAVAIVLMEGTVALAVLASTGLAGGWIVRLLGLSPAYRSERLIIGAGMGIGCLPLLVLGLGCAGVLTRPVAWVLVAGLAVAGIVRFILDWRTEPVGFQVDVTGRRGFANELGTDPPPSGTRRLLTLERYHWIWLVLCPFLALVLLAGSLPPGVLWREEAAGYDVLEYHLAVPKAFWEAGQIFFIPTNVYSNFPLASEMLSLLMMTLHGDPIQASHMAVITNAGLAALFVAAAWLAASHYSKQAGLVAGVLAGATPWITYLAGIAYVEVGMLALGMCALAAAMRPRVNIHQPGRWHLAAGALAGLACGYKYTAIPFIALPIALVALSSEPFRRQRIFGALTVVSTAALLFSPWMIRNIVNTGNPVYPLAYSVFGQKNDTWDSTLEDRWQRSHGSLEPSSEGHSMPVVVYQRTLGDFRFGMVPLLLGIIGAVRHRDRHTVVLLCVLLIQLVVWIGATHLFARFAVVMLLPLLLLAARSMELAGPGERLNDLYSRLILSIVVFGAGWGLFRMGSLYHDHTRVAGSPIHAYGQTRWFVNGQWPGTQHVGALNALGDDARVMMVGEARSFYIQPHVEYATVFNHHPLSRKIQGTKDAAQIMDWMRGRGTSHVLVHWPEMHRLRHTYGDDDGVDRSLFDRLEDAGLLESAAFHLDDAGPAYATLYMVKTE